MTEYSNIMLYLLVCALISIIIFVLSYIFVYQRLMLKERLVTGFIY